MYVFRVEGRLSEQEKATVAYLIDQAFGSEVSISTKESGLLLDLNPDTISSMSAAVSVVVSVISLYLTLRKQTRDKNREEELDAIRIIRKGLGKELRKLGIQDFVITELEGIDAFVTGKNDGACSIAVSSGTAHFKVRMSRKGDVHIIEIA